MAASASEGPRQPLDTFFDELLERSFDRIQEVLKKKVRSANDAAVTSMRLEMATRFLRLKIKHKLSGVAIKIVAGDQVALVNSLDVSDEQKRCAEASKPGCGICGYIYVVFWPIPNFDSSGLNATFDMKFS